MGLIWETSLGVFLFLTCFLGGGAAWLSGRAIALTWRSYWQVFAYILLLSGAVRFLHFALFEGTLLSFHYFIVDFFILFVSASLGFRITRVRQMVVQYRWIYERAWLLFWRARNT